MANPDDETLLDLLLTALKQATSRYPSKPSAPGERIDPIRDLIEMADAAIADPNRPEWEKRIIRTGRRNLSEAYPLLEVLGRLAAKPGAQLLLEQYWNLIFGMTYLADVIATDRGKKSLNRARAAHMRAARANKPEELALQDAIRASLPKDWKSLGPSTLAARIVSKVNQKLEAGDHEPVSKDAIYRRVKSPRSYRARKKVSALYKTA
jgi:hypothetical protein